MCKNLKRDNDRKQSKIITVGSTCLMVNVVMLTYAAAYDEPITIRAASHG